ncbi:Hypothetical predicted protein [Pelobates cultripes]|uniref:Uncharacterized protein n=1 Tax=Pelobates cultripes TaxID=61616 RepID=A0AAD1VXI4_PELCU|nr:Hypothetical predicted protein [Pelobates cultripes]
MAIKTTTIREKERVPQRYSDRESVTESDWGRQSIIGTQKLTETFTERAPCRFYYKKMSEEEYQNVDHLRMQTFSHNIKDFKTSSSSRPLQPASFPPPSSRVLYGLATLCVGLLIVTAMLSVYITYQAVKGTDQRPESMLTNLSVTSNSKVESLTHKEEENQDRRRWLSMEED